MYHRVKKDYGIIFLLFVLGFILYYRSIYFGFILDDIIYLHFLKSNVLNPINIFIFNKNFFYRPVTFSFWYIDYIIWGDNGVGFHITNIIFHINL